MQSTLTIVFSQLATSLPLLLVLIGGIVWAAMLWRRAPKAAMLAMAGLVIMLVSLIASVTITAYIISNRTVAAASPALQISGFAFGIARAVGLGLVVAAVFANRQQVGGAFPVEPLNRG